MREQKKYHQRKLAIIEMIERCTELIDREDKSLVRFQDLKLINPILNCQDNIKRYEKIKKRLSLWLSE